MRKDTKIHQRVSVGFKCLNAIVQLSIGRNDGGGDPAAIGGSFLLDKDMRIDKEYICIDKIALRIRGECAGLMTGLSASWDAQVVLSNDFVVRSSIGCDWRSVVNSVGSDQWLSRYCAATLAGSPRGTIAGASEWSVVS